MILRKTNLQSSKGLRTLRVTAMDVLQKLAKAGGVPEPHFDHQISKSNKKPGHIWHCRFHVPEFVNSLLQRTKTEAVCGAGNDIDTDFAKTLAALEVIQLLEKHTLEGIMNQKAAEGGKRGLSKAKIRKLRQKVQENFLVDSIVVGSLERLEQAKQRLLDERQTVPVEQQIPGVSWENLPLDTHFNDTLPASRSRRIEFLPSLIENRQSFEAAKALTLASRTGLPVVSLNSTRTRNNKTTHWANITAANKQHQQYQNGGDSLGAGPVVDDKPIGKEEAVVLALEQIHTQMCDRSSLNKMLELAKGSRSFGMAKLFVRLPEHQLPGLQKLLTHCRDNPIALLDEKLGIFRRKIRHRWLSLEQDRVDTEARVEAFRRHQRQNPLPVDQVEKLMPHDAAVTIVRGGTGSGKTTRYPLMLSLFSPRGAHTKVVVAQPRRLACQAAAERVAFEQGCTLGGDKCPIGYSIRFESRQARGSRTVDFCTPGVLLRRAMEDPLLHDVSHLCIDEVHERNADIDLLLALAKQAVKARANHPELAPLKLILMSATVQSDTWHRYFSEESGLDVTVVDVPEIRRFPIDMVHICNRNMPSDYTSLRALAALSKGRFDELDEQLCKATAELALHLFNTDRSLNGSVLCFLPGMDEIRLTDDFIGRFSMGRKKFKVIYLHSSVSSRDQQKVFEAGPKVILSTNIAETSLTIPDVKYVIDSGRERQHSMLENANKKDKTSVVGSELATVNISQASAKQRAGRAGRVSAGTCYRLYTEYDLEREFSPHTIPEMLRMDLSQLVLHALSFHNEDDSVHPMHLLLNAPDPPTKSRLRQTLRTLAYQGLVKYDPKHEDQTRLTPLGRAVSAVPAPPNIGRMLFMGLALRAIRPALRIAAILSVPRLFSLESLGKTEHCSDIVRLLEAYHKYAEMDDWQREDHPDGRLFSQVRRIEWQLEKFMLNFIRRKAEMSNVEEVMDGAKWNENSDRVAAVIALVCSATPHIAHLVRGDTGFATRDFAEQARIHPSSANHSNDRRVHWYVYNELRVTKKPYIHATTAVSPLDLALFADPSDAKVGDDNDGEFGLDEWFGPDESFSDGSANLNKKDKRKEVGRSTFGSGDSSELLFNALDRFGGGASGEKWDSRSKGLKDSKEIRALEELATRDDKWLFVVDQWVPVDVSEPSQRDTFMALRNLLTGDMLQQVAQDPAKVLESPEYKQIVLYALSALEQQRLTDVSKEVAGAPAPQDLQIDKSSALSDDDFDDDDEEREQSGQRNRRRGRSQRPGKSERQGRAEKKGRSESKGRSERRESPARWDSSDGWKFGYG